MRLNLRQNCFLCSALVVLVLGILALAACGASITGKLERGGTGEFNVSAALEPAITNTIRSLSQGLGGAGANGGDLILDAPAIALSMTKAPGVASVSFRNTGPTALEGPIKIDNIREFLTPSGGSSGKVGFITFTENPGGGGRAAITLSREAGPDMLALISREISGYLSVLLAPIATGENLSKIEYQSQVGQIYGAAVAREISEASIRASVEFPGAISGVKGGTFSGKKAEFIIPLLDLLVLEQPLSYEVVWR